MKIKYDWNKIKLEFFSNPSMEVKDFFETKYSTYTGHIKSMTKGWTKEKQEFIQKCKNLATQEMINEGKEIYKPSVQELSTISKGIFICIQAKLKEMTQKIQKDEQGNIILPDNFNVKELESIWRIVRTEQGLPISMNRVQYMSTKEIIKETETVILY